jgi:hypothetical protein
LNIKDEKKEEDGDESNIGNDLPDLGEDSLPEIPVIKTNQSKELSSVIYFRCNGCYSSSRK